MMLLVLSIIIMRIVIIRLDDGDIGQYGGHVDHEVGHDVDGNREDHLEHDDGN